MKEIVLLISFGFTIGFASCFGTIYVSDRHHEEMKRIEAVMAQIQKCTDNEKIEDQVIKTAPKNIQKMIKKRSTSTL
jgi:hypothetical protein